MRDRGGHQYETSLVELVRELTHKYHWSMLPLYPMLRWGWAGAALVAAAAAMSGPRAGDLGQRGGGPPPARSG